MTYLPFCPHKGSFFVSYICLLIFPATVSVDVGLDIQASIPKPFILCIKKPALHANDASPIFSFTLDVQNIQLIEFPFIILVLPLGAHLDFFTVRQHYSLSGTCIKSYTLGFANPKPGP